MKQLLIALILSAFGLVDVRAGDYYDGQTDSGYTYHSADGYWWYEGYPYTREQWQYTYGASYDCYGRCYSAPHISYFWKYFRVPNYTPPIATLPTLPQLPEPPDNWERDGIKWLTKRDRLAAYLQFVKTAGPGLPIDQGALLGYGSPGYVGSPFNYNFDLSSAGAQGTTKYGYVVNGSGYKTYTAADVAAYYGKSDPGLLVQQQMLLAKALIDSAGKSTGDSNALVQAFAQGQSDAANKLAAGLAAAAALNAAQGQGSSSSVSVQTGAQVQTGTQPPVVAPPPMPAAVDPPQSLLSPDQGPRRDLAFQGRVALDCAPCHVQGKSKDGVVLPNRLKGGLDLSDYAALPKETKAKVVARLTTADEERRMPRVPDGSEDGADGKPLAMTEIYEFARH